MGLESIEIEMELEARLSIVFEAGDWTRITRDHGRGPDVAVGDFADLVHELASTRPQRCEACGYSLRGLRRGTPCPECGRFPTPEREPPPTRDEVLDVVCEVLREQLGLQDRPITRETLLYRDLDVG